MQSKTCKTCDRREFSLFGTRCNYSGVLCTIERLYPTACGRDYMNGWIQRRPFWKRLFGINK